MDFYWVYNLPNWQFFLLTIAIFIAFSLLGAFAFSEKLEKKLDLTVEHNSIVATFLSLSGVFYGITLGLIAVGTFENFNSTADKVNKESSSLAALYRDVSILEKPEKAELQATLKKYTEYVINEAWPLQQQGIVPKGGTKLMDVFQGQFANYLPETDRDKIIYAEVFDQFNELIEARRLRLNAVNGGLPATIWLILFMGAFVNIVLTWLLVIGNKKLDIVINVLSGLLLGSLIFLIAAMDNPFRGSYSVGSESFQLLLDGLMK
jgi:amino acid transporter